MTEYWKKNMEHVPTREYYEAIKKICEDFTPESVFEIGTGWAISGSAFLESGVKRFVSVDANLTAEYGLITVKELESKKGETQDVELINAKIENVAPELIAKGEKFDMVFIDGDHGYEGCLRDIWYAHELVAENGAIVLDDFLHAKNMDERGYGIYRAAREYMLKTGKQGHIYPTSVNGELVIYKG